MNLSGGLPLAGHLKGRSCAEGTGTHKPVDDWYLRGLFTIQHKFIYFMGILDEQCQRSEGVLGLSVAGHRLPGTALRPHRL